MAKSRKEKVFRPPPLNGINLKTPTSKEDAQSNLGDAMSRVMAIWSKIFETNLNEPAHHPMLGGDDEDEWTRGSGLHYPPLTKIKGYTNKNGNATAHTTREMARALTSATTEHSTLFEQYHFIWDLFISCKSAYVGWDFFTSEYDDWDQSKRSIWFTLLVDVTAHFLVLQMMMGKKGLRFICLGTNARLVWPFIIDAALVKAKAALSSSVILNTSNSYEVDYFHGAHPSAASKFLSLVNREELDQALTGLHAETLSRIGRIDESGNVIGITLFSSTCPQSQNYSSERLTEMKQDALKRRGGYEGEAVYELDRPMTDEELRIHNMFLNRGSKVARLGNELQNEHVTPFADMSNDKLHAVFVAKCECAMAV